MPTDKDLCQHGKPFPSSDEDERCPECRLDDLALIAHDQDPSRIEEMRLQEANNRCTRLAMMIEGAVDSCHKENGVSNTEILEVIGSLFISTVILGGNKKEEFLKSVSVQYDEIMKSLLKGGATLGAPVDEEKIVH